MTGYFKRLWRGEAGFWHVFWVWVVIGNFAWNLIIFDQLYGYDTYRMDLFGFITIIIDKTIYKYLGIIGTFVLIAIIITLYSIVSILFLIKSKSNKQRNIIKTISVLALIGDLGVLYTLTVFISIFGYVSSG